jgi:nifR3 family TIM-barrel protein
VDACYVGEINRGVPPAGPGEFPAPSVGPLQIWPPVVLAPMAGITNFPFRMLCRRFGAGLYVSEMITARALVERNARTLKLAGFNPQEQPRSLQLYSVDPHYLGEAVKWLVEEDWVDHIDLNFGCPVRKVTRRGGGAAVPVKPRLLASIVRAAVRNAGAVPVTIKFRIGIHDQLITHLDAGRVAQEEGCASVALHARTASQMYDGEARWEAIGELKAAVTHIPVFGNGDIWEAWDALRMMRSTGCDGVVVGRGCLGRPWLFRDLADVFEGRQPQNPPCFGEIVEVMLEHAKTLCEWFDDQGGDSLRGRRGSGSVGMRSFRKHATWYTKGFPQSAQMRAKLIRVESLRELEKVLAEGDPLAHFPPQVMRVPRGKTGGRRKVVLPEGYLDDLEDATPPCAEAELDISGG